jgi:large subunit ribosomal protein L29
MATQKATDLRQKDDGQLVEQMMELKKETFNLRFQRATGQLANTARVRAVRRIIAQIQTVLSERKRASGKAK